MRRDVTFDEVEQLLASLAMLCGQLVVSLCAGGLAADLPTEVVLAWSCSFGVVGGLCLALHLRLAYKDRCMPRVLLVLVGVVGVLLAAGMVQLIWLRCRSRESEREKEEANATAGVEAAVAAAAAAVVAVTPAETAAPAEAAEATPAAAAVAAVAMAVTAVVDGICQEAAGSLASIGDRACGRTVDDAASAVTATAAAAADAEAVPSPFFHGAMWGRISRRSSGPVQPSSLLVFAVTVSLVRALQLRVKVVQVATWISLSAAKAWDGESVTC
jgi:hypothetical protein